MMMMMMMMLMTLLLVVDQQKICYKYRSITADEKNRSKIIFNNEYAMDDDDDDPFSFSSRSLRIFP